MCGICGVFYFDQRPVDKNNLLAMNDAMLHRGPDDAGFYQDPGVGLAMRRLSIIDTEGGHQPISNEDDSVWVVMNGEIYNYIELRNELIQKGHRFRTQSDTEVIVHLYEEEGRNAIHKLNGMFAFALYDKKNHSLWIARDRLGIKPLYFKTTPTGVFFASDLTALGKLFSDKKIDHTALLFYLGFHYIPKEKSIYQDIHKLLPGHELICNAQGVRENQYWQLTTMNARQINQKEAADELRDLLEDAVRLQMRSDVPVGTLLSGGVDSSCITAFAAQHSLDALNTFTIDFNGKHSQDAFFAKKIAQRYDTRHHEIGMSTEDASQVIDEIIPFLDEPIADSAIIPTYWIAKQARARGIKVLLTGAGGDELFGGYARHHAPKVGTTSWLAETLPTSLRGLASLLLSPFHADRAMRMRHPEVAFGAGCSGANLAALNDMLQHKKDFTQLFEGYIDQLSGMEKKDGNKGYAYSRMHIDLTHYLVDDILALNDKMTMACSVEARVPLLDHRLVEFAFAMRESVNLLNAKDKGLLKHVLKSVLPDELLTRKKDGFNSPLRSWYAGRLGQKITEDLLDNSNPLFADMLNRQKLARVLKLAQQGYPVVDTVFALYVFNQWHHAQVKLPVCY